MKHAFTLVELLVTIVIIGVLAALLMPAVSAAKIANSRTLSTHSLHTLGAAGRCYLNDHDNIFWKSSQNLDGGTQWWFGWESFASMSKPEGKRELDYSRGTLGPYSISCSNVPTDPAFLAYSPRLKPKYKNGNYGYGYNTFLANKNALQAPSTQIAMFATAAQVNTFQSPASPKNPMIEEFYFIYDSVGKPSVNPTVHFRHGGKALAVLLDGSVQELEMQPGTQDKRMPTADIGCLNSQYLSWSTQ